MNRGLVYVVYFVHIEHVRRVGWDTLAGGEFRGMLGYCADQEV